MARPIWATATFCLTLLSGCGASATGSMKSINEAASGLGHVAPGNTALAVVQQRDDSSQDPSLASRTVGGFNDFALNLYRNLPRTGNVAISPLGVASALSLTYAGAKGETARQMATALGLPQDRKAALAGVSSLEKTLASRRDSAATLLLADRIWLQSGLKVAPTYKEVLHASFPRAPLQSVNFAATPTKARDTINDWIAQASNGKIPTLLNNVSPDTKLLVTNTVYYKGLWFKPFRQDATRPTSFFVAPGQTVVTPMMSQQENFAYADVGLAQIVELPYRDGREVMDLIVPKSLRGLDEVEAQLDASTLSRWLAGLQESWVSLTLPRFRTESTVSLRSTLAQMGLRAAFDPTVADFSGLTPSTPLVIAEVAHQATVAVNEGGTEAAGATGEVMIPAADTTEKLSVNADRPFLYLIRDVDTGTVMFIGRESVPTVVSTP